jgi:hypothetical protein
VLTELEPPWIDSSAVDYIAAFPKDSFTPGIIIGATEISAGRTLAAWTDGTAGATCGPTDLQEPLIVDGETGILAEFPLCKGLHHLWGTVIRDTTAYHIVWIGGREDPDDHRDLYMRVVASFRFGTGPTQTPPATPTPSAP